VENSSAPLKPLLLIAALVLAAHWAFLSWVQPSTSLESNTAITRPFITRTLALPEPAPAVVRPSKPATSQPRSSSLPPEIRTSNAAPDHEKQPQEAIDKIANEATTVTAPPTESTTPTPPAPADEPLATVAAIEPAAAPPSAPISLPGSLRLKYDIKGEVSGLGYSASGELLWLHDDQTYDARLSVTHFLLGTRSQSSSGQLTPEGLAPKRFGDKVRSEVAAHFERDKGKVIFSANTPSVDLQPGAQDQLSIFMQIASLLAGDPSRYPVGSAFEMQAVGGRDADTWRFTVESEERLVLPGGEQATLRIKRPARQVHDITVELWLAPALGYLPARIRLTQTNGNFVDQQLASFATP
jgi:hypothetical protein